MLTFARDEPFPRCRHCGDRLSYYVPGLPDEEHAHPECSGIDAAQAAFRLAYLDKLIAERMGE